MRQASKKVLALGPELPNGTEEAAAGNRALRCLPPALLVGSQALPPVAPVA